MNEGLFKKRMNEVFADFDKESVDFLLQPFIDIVDEARKDFEKLIFGTWSLEFNEEGEQVYNPNATAPDSWLTPSEAIKWFRKWFGEQK